MKTNMLILITTLCLSVSTAIAAEKSKALVQLDAARAAVEALAGKIGDNKEAAVDLELARVAIKKGTDISDKGRQLFGFGDMKPESEKEIKNYAEIADLATVAAAARLEKARATSELEALDKQLTTVKAKIKIFEDRKAELEKFKAEAAKCRNSIRELETLKAENGLLSSKSEKQQAEIKALTAQLEEARKAAAHKEKVEPAKPVKAMPPSPLSPTATVDVPSELKELLPVETIPAAEVPAKTNPAPAKETP